ncbi:FAD-dependent oxidoreductase [Halobaculum sp. CBA1158]|uniref:NAD(P)/FAD-dependent oxidoreductase n=1 Tax=Halobaculum sp. CBA1158 TaxID=2904243 RepID=UPI001F1EF31A|nr:FAD-dependent oxidoreductase [Halobaculum sp. CBA1158]UIO98980.1 FAD-dependent oxidoreductase [Halobaculum sp. CBA1158]
MSTQVVVVGAGYAGAGTVKAFEDAIEPDEAELTWVSEHDYHLVLHEAHRVIRKPEVESKVAIPVEEIKSDDTEFVRGRVTEVDADERVVRTRAGDEIDYDYLLLAVGSATAFFGIDGLREHALTLKTLDDAREIHQAVKTAGEEATTTDPAKVIVGGAGLSGIQSAGEIAEFRDDHKAPIDVEIVEGLDSVFPNNDPEVQGAIRKRLDGKEIGVSTGEFISKVDEHAVYLGGAETEYYGEDGEGDAPAPEDIDFSDDLVMEYDVLLWTGGITGHDEVDDFGVDADDRSGRVYAESTFETSADGVFAIGDTALVEQDDDEVAPPTAQAAWQAADVAGENLARAVRGAPLKSWRHEDKGTLISIGEEVVAHDVQAPGFKIPVNTFGGPAAKALKKGVASRWIADVTSLGRAVNAWGDM